MAKRAAGSHRARWGESAHRGRVVTVRGRVEVTPNPPRRSSQPTGHESAENWVGDEADQVPELEEAKQQKDQADEEGAHAEGHRDGQENFLR